MSSEQTETAGHDVASAHTATADRALVETAPVEAGLALVVSARSMPSTSPNPSPSPGDVLDQYRIIGRLGAGGMGEVYEALDVGLDRKVALKVIRAGSDDPEQRRRFLREARAMAKLSHPNVVSIYQVGSDAGIDFIAMELVDGTDLSRWRKHEVVGWRDVVRVYAEAGRGLAAAHAHGMVHRDFKPANVLIASDGQVRVTDFGLAKLARDQPEPITAGLQSEVDEVGLDQLRTITAYGEVMGTPAYMAPELLTGEPASPASDQYAFCVALYRTLTGRLPWDAPLEELQEVKAAGEPIQWPPGPEPGWVRRVVERGMSREPAQRFESMDEVLRALRPRWRRWVMLAAGGLVAVGAVLGLVQSMAEPDPEVEIVEAEGGVACSELPDALAASWSDAALERARARVEDIELPRASVARTGARLGAYLGQLQHAYAEACRIDDPKARFMLEGCLDRRRERLELIAQGLRSDDALQAEWALAARWLPPVATCTERGLGADGSVVPDDPELARQVREVRSELARIEALVDGRRSVEAMARIDSVLEQARSLAHAPTVAEALVVAGEALLVATHFPRARTVLEEAVLVAEEAGVEPLRARALVGLAVVLVRSELDQGATAQAFRRASGALRRGPPQPELSAWLNAHRALVAVARGGPLDELKGALQRYRDVPDHSRTRQGVLEMSLVEQLTHRGLYEDARSLCAKTLQDATALLGVHHPDVWRLQEWLASILLQLGRYDEAHTHFEAVSDLWQSEAGRRQRVLLLGETATAIGRTRSIALRVLDPEGNAVQGAEVVAANALKSNGKYLLGGGWLWRHHEQPVRTFTDADGRAVVEDVSAERAIMIAAEHDAAGRSVAVDVPLDHDGAELSLSLRPWGRLEGSFEVEGLDWPRRAVVLASVEIQAPRRANVEVVAQGDRFEVPRLPAGRYHAYFSVERREDMIMERRSVEIAAGATAQLDERLRFSGPQLEVTIDPGHGPSPAKAEVYLTVGAQQTQSTFELERFLPAALTRGPVQRRAIRGDEVARFRRLTGGTHSLCAHFTWDSQVDPQRLAAARTVDRRMICQVVEVEAEGDVQRVRFGLGL